MFFRLCCLENAIFVRQFAQSLKQQQQAPPTQAVIIQRNEKETNVAASFNIHSFSICFYILAVINLNLQLAYASAWIPFTFLF